MGLTFLMLALLLGCYGLCAALVLFAEHLMRTPSLELAEGADLPQSDTEPQIGTP